MTNEYRRILKTLDDATEEMHGVRPYGTEREDNREIEAKWVWIEGQGIVKVWELTSHERN